MTPGSPTGAARSRIRPDAMLLVGALLVVVQTVVRVPVVLGSYYWQDDFVHLDLARRLGLSQEFLVRDHNDHLEIGANLVYRLIAGNPGSSFLPAALWLLALQVAASCLLLAVLRELFGRSPWLLVPFAAYLFTPLGLPVATWLASGLEALPVQAGMLLALLGLVRAIRRQSWRWAVVSLAGHAVALLFYEKALLILPVLLAVVLLVECAGEPGGRRLRRLVGQWPYLVGHAVLTVVHASVYFSVVDRATREEGPDGALPWLGETVLGLLLPGFLGGPWTNAGADNTRLPDVADPVGVLAALLMSAAVVASVWLRGRRALNGWALVVGHLAVDAALVLFGRGELLELVTRDPRYFTDAFPVVVIGWCAAFSGPRVPRVAPDRMSRVAGSTTAALAGTAALAASGLASTLLLAPELQHRDARSYVERVVHTMDDSPVASVVSSQPPGHVNLFGYPGLDGMLRALGQERRFDAPGTEMAMFDGSAQLWPITVIGLRLQATGPAQGCGWSVGAGTTPLGQLPAGTGAAEVVRLGYLAGGPATLHLAVGEDEQELALTPGAGHAFFVVTHQDGPVEVRVTGAGSPRVCVIDVVAGSPWPVEEP